MSLNASFDSGITGLPWKNTSDTTAPPHAVVVAFGHEYDDTGRIMLLKGRRSTSDDASDPSAFLVLNGPTQVDPGGRGTCYIASHHPAWVAIDPTVLFPPDLDNGSFAYEFGPEADKWTAKRDVAGYTYVGHRLDETTFQGDRVLVYRNLERKSRRFVKITSTSKFLDGFYLHPSDQDLGGGNYYLEGKFVDEPYFSSVVSGVGPGQEDGPPIKVFASDSLRGILFNGVVCEVEPKRAKSIYLGATDETVYVALNGGVECFSGYVIDNVNHPMYEVSIQNPSTFAGTGVAVWSLYGDSFSIGQRVSVAWDYRLTDSTPQTSTWLRITDWGCAT
jgi:hypothetical protein